MARSDGERLRVLWRSPQGSRHARQRDSEGDLDIRVVRGLEEALELRDWAQVLVSGKVEDGLLDGMALQHIVVPWAGVRPELAHALRSRRHLTLSNSHYNDSPVAQHAVALLLAAANRIPEADRELRRGRWLREDEEFRSLALPGRYALLLGYGSIGKKIAVALRGLGMKILVYRNSPGEPDAGVEREYGPGELSAALERAHVAMLSLPSTDRTRGLLGEEELNALPAGAVLVNVGRGDVIDQWALYHALEGGRLRAAGVDVWWQYPKEKGGNRLPAAAPLHALPNVVMSPHRADMVDDWEEACFEDVMETLREFASGRIRNRVDVDRGY